MGYMTVGAIPDGSVSTSKLAMNAATFIKQGADVQLLTTQMLYNEVYIAGLASLAAASINWNMAFSDATTDSNGYSNSIDTGASTASYDSVGKAYIIAREGIIRYKFDEGAGTTASNWSNPGTQDLTVGNNWVTGKLAAKAWNAGAGYASLAHNSNLLPSNYTIAFWFNFAAVGTYPQLFSKAAQSSSATVYYTQFRHAGGDVMRSHAPAYDNDSAAQTINAATWYHYLTTWNGTTGAAVAYLNNTSIASGTAGTTLSGTLALLFGAGYNGSGNSPGTDIANIAMQDFRLYNSVVSTAARNAIYNSGTGTFDNVITTTADLITTTITLGGSYGNFFLNVNYTGTAPTCYYWDGSNYVAITPNASTALAGGAVTSTKLKFTLGATTKITGYTLAYY